MIREREHLALHACILARTPFPFLMDGRYIAPLGYITTANSHIWPGRTGTRHTWSHLVITPGHTFWLHLAQYGGVGPGHAVHNDALCPQQHLDATTHDGITHQSSSVVNSRRVRQANHLVGDVDGIGAPVIQACGRHHVVHHVVGAGRNDGACGVAGGGHDEVLEAHGIEAQCELVGVGAGCRQGAIGVEGVKGGDGDRHGGKPTIGQCGVGDQGLVSGIQGQV
mmetsp:Transcript_27666/g.60597  ORF Transcript_27666/g.60597 Transcript_27666/m.60597 type:complete len:224 (-) Transcript_27666:2466-3137(-)